MYNEIKIYTGNFANLKKYAGAFPVSIALTSPNWFHSANYRKFNPKWSYMHDSIEDYTAKFNAHLSQLDPAECYKELKKLSKGKDVVLLCHEKEGDFCHRHLVARWLQVNLHITVKELGRAGLDPNPTLFDI